MSVIWKGRLSHVDVEVHVVSSSDQHAFFLVWEKKGICIDPFNTISVAEFIDENNIEITSVFITHHNPDHADTIEEIVKKYDVNVVGPFREGVTYVQQTVAFDDELITGPFLIKVLFIPGHTVDHVAYYLPEKHLLFCGDIIFGGWYDREMEGTIDQLFSSIKALAHLPKDTVIFFNHEYTIQYLEFAKTIEPLNPIIDTRIETEKNKLAIHQSTAPTTLEIEFQTNPLFRVKEPSIRKQLQMENSTDAEVFTKIKSLRDQYRKQHG